jgi:hypothetical protein
MRRNSLIFLSERNFAPLGMKDTDFYVPFTCVGRAHDDGPSDEQAEERHRDVLRRRQWRVQGMLLTQRMLESPVPPCIMTDFWTLAYQAIEE